MEWRSRWRETVVTILIFANFSVWSLVFANKESDLLSVYFLDVGQGDSIFIESPNGNRVLIDGGPDKKVLSELGKVLPFGDKRIDVVLATHPDSDHIMGLIEVFKRYDIGAFIEPGVESDNLVDDALRLSVDEEKVPKILARRGMTLDLGSGVVLTILFPNQDVSNWETNDASVVAKLVYGNKSFLLTGDSTKNSEYKMIAWGENVLDSDVLQVGHHGSQTSTSFLYAKVVSPEYAVVSAGKNNRYGHPHKDTLDTLNKVGSKVISTIEMGTIKFETDGETLWVN